MSLVNWVLSKLGMYYHMQKLSDSKYAYRGRAWIALIKKRPSISFEWNLWSSHCLSEVNFDPMDDRVSIGLSIPPVAMWFGVNGLPAWFFRKLGMGNYEGREIRFAIHDWRIWISLWGNTHSWHSDDPWWKEIVIDPSKILFGKDTYERENIKVRDVVVPMPEKNYKATATLYRWTKSRTRLPFAVKTGLNVEIDMNEPIPHPGKGTAEYNCGEDASHSLSSPVKNISNGIEDGIGKVVSSVLWKRNNYPL